MWSEIESQGAGVGGEGVRILAAMATLTRTHSRPARNSHDVAPGAGAKLPGSGAEEQERFTPASFIRDVV